MSNLCKVAVISFYSHLRARNGSMEEDASYLLFRQKKKHLTGSKTVLIMKKYFVEKVSNPCGNTRRFMSRMNKNGFKASSTSALEPDTTPFPINHFSLLNKHLRSFTGLADLNYFLSLTKLHFRIFSFSTEIINVTLYN